MWVTAHSKLNKHQQEIELSELALTIDPQYSNSYGRMGQVVGSSSQLTQ